MDVLATLMANHLNRYWYGPPLNRTDECVSRVLWRLAFAAVAVTGVVGLLGLVGLA